MTAFSEVDRQAMQRALALAARGLTSTDPNPRVGCVIVQGERVVAEGWHQQAGGDHAEVVALAAAGEQAAGATVYVTLEPCSHHGRTPPCVEALLQARVARVVYAATDPNPQVNGQGAAALRGGGVVVEGGLLERESIELNCGFVKRMQQGRPWVRVKLAMSLDGRTALGGGESRWITGEAARENVQHWRARSSAILIGIGTVLADDPRLDVRLPAPPPGQALRQPLRVVLDSRLRTPPAARLLDGSAEVLLFTSQDSLENTQAGAALSERGVRIESVPEEDGRLALGAMLDRLGELEINELQVEAGPTVAGELVRQALVDELLLYVAPRVLGHEARPLLEIPGPLSLGEAFAFDLIDAGRLGEDLRLRLRPRADPAAEPPAGT